MSTTRIRHEHHSHQHISSVTIPDESLIGSTDSTTLELGMELFLTPTTSPLYSLNLSRNEIKELEIVKSFPVEPDIIVEATDANYFNISIPPFLEAAVTNQTGNPELQRLIIIAVPIMLFFCIVTVLVNLAIVISARWCRKPMSPTLYFSLSLALADAYASFILGTGLLVNTLLPNVFGIRIEDVSLCINLSLEAFRLAGILVANLHLLALAINHWIGIVRPLHYAATMTRRTAWIVIINAWIWPIVLIFLIFSTKGGEGFLSPNCENCNFLQHRAFRGVFASLFFAPLLVMSLIYLHIFLIVRNHHNHRLRYQSSQQLKRNVKAVMTTVLILGTYIVGWMPAQFWSLIVCDDCVIQLNQVPWRIKYGVGVFVNTLVILKAFVDPIIYAARMADIQVALKKMRYDFSNTFCKSCLPATSEPELERCFSTKYGRCGVSMSQETKSVRVSSFGSNTSSKRTTSTTTSSNRTTTNSTNSSPRIPPILKHHHHSSTNGPSNNNHGIGNGVLQPMLYQNGSKYILATRRSTSLEMADFKQSNYMN